MSIRPVSAIRPYDLIWSGDSALTLAPIPPEPVRLPDEGDDSLRDRTEAWKQDAAAVRAANSALYDRAIESGEWAPILRAGDAPTRFRVRQIPGSAWRTLERVGEGLKAREWLALVFRLGVTDILDGPIGAKVALVDHLGLDGKPTGLGPVLPVEVCDALDRIEPAIINDLALLIVQQRSGPSGK